MMYQVYYHGEPVSSYFHIQMDLTVDAVRPSKPVLARYPNYDQAWTHIWEAQGKPVEDALNDGWAIEEIR